MTLEVRDSVVSGEHEFVIYDPRPHKKQGTRVRIHPWSRRSEVCPGEVDDSVYVEVDWYKGKKRYTYIDKTGHEFNQNIIVDRAEFVEGILAVFPELKRA